jgi:hypothetical protein
MASQASKRKRSSSASLRLGFRVGRQSASLRGVLKILLLNHPSSSSLKVVRGKLAPWYGCFATVRPRESSARGIGWSAFAAQFKSAAVPSDTIGSGFWLTKSLAGGIVSGLADCASGTAPPRTPTTGVAVTWLCNQ